MDSKELTSSSNSSYSHLAKHRINKIHKRRKILVLGAQSVGKTSIILSLKKKPFRSEYEPTIQSSYNHRLELQSEVDEMEIIDLEGQSEYTIFTQNKYCFNFNGYVLVYSIDNKQSFNLIKSINKKLDEQLSGQKIAKVLIGNKTDNLQREVNYQDGFLYANEIKCPFFECSAKDNINIIDSFKHLLVEINKIEENFDMDKLSCKKIMQCFVHYYNRIRKFFYFLMSTNILFALFSMGVGLYIGIKTNDNEENKKKSEFFPLFYGLWITVFSFIGLYGMSKKDCEFLYLYRNGIGISFVIIISGDIFYFIFKNEHGDINEEVKKIKNIYYQYFSSVFFVISLVGFLFAMAFNNIYKKDLLFYIL